MSMIDAAVGKSERYVEWDHGFECLLHVGLKEPLVHLRDAAAHAGFQLAIASGFRSFERQLMIWNAKIAGDRPVLDSQGQEMDVQTLSEVELMWAVLRWSALPGASRHHWGTDIDIYDAKGLSGGQTLQLTVEETLPGGIFAGFHQWLDDYLNSGVDGFFHPYKIDRGGIAPEPWHLSYAPIALEFQQALTLDLLQKTILNTDIELKNVILAHLDEIFTRYVRVPISDYPGSTTRRQD